MAGGDAPGSSQQQQQQQQLLGLHPNAAWELHPGLPGVSGPMLPMWRRVAEVGAGAWVRKP